MPCSRLSTASLKGCRTPVNKPSSGMGNNNKQPQAAALLTERRLAFSLLLAMAVCLGMGQTVTFAILPPIGRELGLTELQVGGVFSVSALLWVLLSPLWGRLSDRFGRKPIILIGMTAYVLSTAMFTGVISYGLQTAGGLLGIYALIVLTRCIYGAFGPGVRVAAQAYIVDRTDLRDRTVAIAGLSAAFGLGNVLGPGLGSALSVFGLLAPLWGIVVFALIITIATMFLLPENSEPGERQKTPRMPMRDPRIRAFLIYGFVISFALATPLQAIAFYFIDMLKLEPAMGAQYAGVGLTSGAMAALFSQLVLVQRFRLSPRTMMLAGAALIGCGQLMLAASSNFGPLVFALMLNGLGGGLAIPGFNAGASHAVTLHEQGAIAGLTGAMGAAGFTIVPLVNFSLYAIAPQLPFLFDAVLMAMLFTFAWHSQAVRSAIAVESEV